MKMHKRLSGVDARKVGGDTGYAGTENRGYCKEHGIQTSFVKRGRLFLEEKKEMDLVRRELARVRATAMEGSFGTRKEHYDIHTASVVGLSAFINTYKKLYLMSRMYLLEGSSRCLA